MTVSRKKTTQKEKKWRLDVGKREEERRKEEDARRAERRMADEKGMKMMRAKRAEQKREENEVFIGAVGAKESEALAMNFQVVGVKKALAAVSKICKMGNIVQFGDEESECFIQNKTTKKKVLMKKKRGSYVIDVEFVRDEMGPDGVARRVKMGREVITIDSGAEESVCPLGWGEAFGMRGVTPGAEMKMISAAGTEMKHYGSRKVVFTAEGF